MDITAEQIDQALAVDQAHAANHHCNDQCRWSKWKCPKWYASYLVIRELQLADRLMVPRRLAP